MSGLAFLDGGGEMGARMRAHDWSTSPLGLPSDWPQSLRSVVGLMLGSDFPMFVAWGGNLGFLYNDSYAKLLHAKHPGALGMQFHDVWPEIWADITPLIDSALAGKATYVEDFPLTTNRKGSDEQAWFTFSYSPVRDESGSIAGMFCAVTETTQKILTDRSLRDSEYRLQSMADALPALVAFVDQDHRYQFCNRAYEEWFGRSTDEIVGHHVRELVGDDAYQRVLPFIERALGGESFSFETMLPYRLGGSRYVHVEYLAQKGADESVEGYYALVTDITEQQKAADALRESEAYLRAVFAQLSEGVIIADTNGKLALVNRAAETIHGVASLDVTPDDYSDVYHLFTEDGRPYPSADLPLARAVTLGETIDDSRWRIRRPDGTEVLAIGSARPIRDDGGTQIASVLTLRDDTPRSRAELALRESEARFRNLADQSPMMVWVTEPDGFCNFLSKSWYEFTGQRKEEALGYGWLDAVHPDDREMSSKAFVESNAAQTSFKIEYRLRGADGNYRWAIDAATPLFGPDGDYLGYVGSVVDIDEQKKLEQSLAERVAEEVERRSQAEQALIQSQKIETLGQLTGGVAHDFNNLLTPIVGALDVAQKSLADDPRAHRLVSGAIQAADRARILVQRLLAFSRRQHLQPRAVDIAGLVNGVSDLIHRSIGPQITLRVDIDPDLPPARVDPNQLELALINLSVNARDAMPDGGMLTITARAEDLADHDRLGDGQFVCIAVADTGTGMTQAVIDRAIEPFFTTKDIGQGTGLGLSSVQGLALQSGGELHLQSKVGHGTTATLWLPVSDQQPARADQVPAAATTARPANLTALLVDDEPLVRAGIAAMLDDLGYGVIEAASAAEATVLADSGISFDLMITDHAMPGRTGTELAHDMRLRRPDLPVLLVTGYAKVAEDGSSGLDRLPKPFRQEDLAERLERLLAGTA
ncbi:MAG: PAS domain S-box protein [Pseudomonadota bacterium]